MLLSRPPVVEVDGVEQKHMCKQDLSICYRLVRASVTNQFLKWDDHPSKTFFVCRFKIMFATNKGPSAMVYVMSQNFETWELKVILDVYWGDAMGYHGYRVLRGGCPRGGGNWGTLRIPFGKIGEP